MILVLFSMQEEAGYFLDWLAKQGLQQQGKVVVEFIGVGAPAVRRSLPGILRKHQPEMVICGGYAGALTADLRLGEVFLAENRGEVCELPRLRKAKVFSSESVVDLAEDRKKLFQETSALAVDMESETVDEIVRNTAVPLVVIRSISDTPEALIPVPFAVAYDLERQKVRKLGTIWWLAARPQEWMDFILFVSRLRTARMNLTVALARTVDHFLSRYA